MEYLFLGLRVLKPLSCSIFLAHFWTSLMSPQFRQEWAPDGPGLIGAAETTLRQHCGRDDDLAPAGQHLRGASVWEPCEDSPGIRGQKMEIKVSNLIWVNLLAWPKIGQPRDEFRTYIRLFANLQTITRLAPLSLGFSNQECWNGLTGPPVGDCLNPGKYILLLTYLSWFKIGF